MAGGYVGGPVIFALDANDTPAPVHLSDLGGGGGGVQPEDISATAPATWDAETSTIGVDIGTGANQAAAGNHSHTPASIGAATAAQGALADSAVQPGDLATVATSGAYADLTGKPVAAHVADADGTDTTTLAASVDAIRDALVAAGLMAAS